MTRFTGFLALVEEKGGADAATRLALRAGGTEMKLSARPTSPLAKIVGAEIARAVFEELGPVKVTIPMAHLRGQRGRQAAAAQMLAEGHSHNQVAQTVDVHERTVRRVREAMKKSSLPLFDRK